MPRQELAGQAGKALYTHRQSGPFVTGEIVEVNGRLWLAKCE
jgi:hypothetical protein